MSQPKWYALFHELWTGYVGTPGYKKEAWINLDNELNVLETEVKKLRREVLPGNHSLRQVGAIMITCMDPTARDVMDRAVEEWRALDAVRDSKPTDPVYSFAYWLFRWSGLIRPENPAEAAFYPYLRHRDDCTRQNEKGPCSCGLSRLFDEDAMAARLARSTP